MNDTSSTIADAESARLVSTMVASTATGLGEIARASIASGQPDGAITRVDKQSRCSRIAQLQDRRPE